MVTKLLMTEVRVLKTSIALPPSYKEKLKLGAKKLGISQSELLRRAIDEYLAKIGLPVVLSSDEAEQPAKASP